MQKETRSFSITDKVLSKTDICILAGVFAEEHQRAQSEKRQSSLALQLTCADSTSYESDSLGLLEDGGPIDVKKTESVHFTFYDYPLGRSMDLSLVESHRGSHLTVRGDDRNWVSGTFTTLSDMVSSVRPQSAWLRKHPHLASNLVSLGIGAAVLLVTDSVVERFVPPIENPTGWVASLRELIWTYPATYYLLRWLIRWWIGAPWASGITSWLAALWPCVEFDFGPEHMNRAKMRRRRLAAIGTLIVVPIGIQLLLDLF